MTSNEIAIATELVGEPRARGRARDDAKLAAANVVTRYWDGIRREHLDICLRGLKTYTALQPGVAPAATAFATNPLVDGQTQDGTWYGGRVWWEYASEPGKQDEATIHVFQELILVTAALEAAYVSSYTPDSYKLDRLYISPYRPISAPDSTQGLLFEATNSMDNRGVYHARLVREQLYARDSGWQVLEETPQSAFQTQEKQVTNASSLPFPVSALGQAQRLNPRYNPKTQLWDYVFTREDLPSGVWGPFVAVRTLDGSTEYLYIYKGQAAAKEVPAAWPGRASFGWNPRDESWDTLLTLRSEYWLLDMDWDNGEEYAFYFESTDGEDIYVYVLLTKKFTDAKAHLTDVALGTVVGGRDGHVTQLRLLGNGKIQALRVEKYGS
jgi:hypothetical protein